jgi:hypothetical protein
VSKSLKPVENATFGTLPSPGASHAYQTEWPPVFPAWSGSPASFEALMLVPSMLPLAGSNPLRSTAAAKSSFAGVPSPADAGPHSSAKDP